jgi:hypothetical protein
MPETPVSPAPLPALAEAPEAAGTGPHVALLRWPEQDAERRRLAALGEPRILVTAPGTSPPSIPDELELWMVESAGAGDLLDGVEGLRRRVRDRGRPVLDGDGLLWFGGRWVSVPDAQLTVVGLLVRNFGRLVRHDELREAYRGAGGSVTSRSFRALLQRLGGRFADVGLRLHSIHRQGVLLAPL